MVPNPSTFSKDEIEAFSNSLTKQQMKLPVSNIMYYRNEILGKLYQMIFDYGELKKPSFYYLYFQPNGNKYDYDSSDLSGHIHSFDISLQMDDASHYINFENQNTQLKLSFQFANFKIFSNWSRSTEANVPNFMFKCNSSFTNTIDCSNLIFSHCQDKEKQLEFTNLIIDQIKSSYINNQIGLNAMKKTLFFYLVIASDNLELIKHVAVEFGEGIVINEIGFIISHFIKSIDVLNYLFENFISLFKSDAAPFHFRNQELFQHFEALYIAKYTNGDGCIIDGNCLVMGNNFASSHFSNNKYFNFDLFKTIIERGPVNSIYSIPIPRIFQMIENECPVSGEIKLDLFKIAFINYRPEISQLISSVRYLPISLDFKRFLQWCYFKIGSHEIQSMQNQYYLWLLFQIGKYEEIFKNNDKVDTLGLKFVITENLDVFNVNFFDHLLPFLESNIHNIDPKTILYSIFNLLGRASKEGRLQTFEYVFQKYIWIIKRKVITGKDGRSRSLNLANKHIKTLIYNSLHNGHIYLSQFLFGYSSASKKDFRYNNPISKQYFANNK